MDPETLIIFDYSGTLSSQAPRFAKPDHLAAQLAECGLAALGIDRTDIFWDEIVLPTWEEGSTTAAGYISLMETRIRERLRRDGDAEPGARAVHHAAARFVERYLNHSVIDPLWEPLLISVATWPGVLVLIATDHYAEATDAIIAHLKERHVEGTPLRDVTAKGRGPEKIVVANSADLGTHKADRPFWEAVRRHLPLNALRRVLIVDDFGAHEQTDDPYGTTDRVVMRRDKTRGMLEDVFHCPVTAPDFNAAAMSSESDRDAFDTLVKRTVDAIQEYVNRNHEPFRCRPDQ